MNIDAWLDDVEERNVARYRAKNGIVVEPTGYKNIPTKTAYTTKEDSGIIRREILDIVNDPEMDAQDKLEAIIEYLE